MSFLDQRNQFTGKLPHEHEFTGITDVGVRVLARFMNLTSRARIPGMTAQEQMMSEEYILRFNDAHIDMVNIGSRIRFIATDGSWTEFVIESIQGNDCKCRITWFQ
jgi:hypothetical protein